MSSHLRAAAQWLAGSGIQLPSGGVARYYDAGACLNRNISTEITGYALSALVYAYRLARADEFLDAANRAAHFLTRIAWDGERAAMPFEVDPAELAYFFDCGIVARGLIALWRVTGECELIDAAQAVAHAMGRDFTRDDGAHWPVISLPAKAPAALDTARWSRVPGCYQLKSAIAWRELAAITGDGAWRELYARALGAALASHETYLASHADGRQAMDRLHPYLYFLEALLPHAEHTAIVRTGAARVRDSFERLAPEFERADVAAQLLRVECAAGAPESQRAPLAALVRAYQRPDGGYYFGRASGHCIPHVSPVPTVFAMQALEWHERPETIARDAVI